MRRGQRWVGQVALALAVGAASATAIDARAGEPAGPAKTAKSAAEVEADRLIREGVELRRVGREAEALERFRAAHEAHPSARALGQMGLAAKSLRLYVVAEAHLAEALAQSDPWVDENRQALELAKDVVGKQLASLQVASNVEGAELFVNGASAGRLPMAEPIRTLAGAAHVELRAPDRAPVRADPTLPSGEMTTLHLDFGPPLAKVDAAEPSTKADASARPSEGPGLVPWIVATAATGVVGVGFGTYYGVKTLSLKSDRDEICPPGGDTCPTGEGVTLDHQARTAATGSTIGFVVGGAGLVAAAILVVVETTGGDAPKQAPAVGAAIDGGSAAFVLTWAY